MDALAIEPLAGPIDAEVRLPGSKSITNRALVCAALADGRSELRGALRADDTEAMIACLTTLGAAVDDRWHVRGTAGRLAPGPIEVDARQSGTTARFVAPLLALGDGDYTLTGHPQLRARPMGPTFDALRELGVAVDAADHLPAVVHAAGGVDGGTIRLPGHVSSQFLSGLLLAAPCFRRGLEVELTSELVSQPYVAMTTAVMAGFGVDVDGLSVAPQAYRPAAFDVEPDATAASYFFAAAALCGGRVRVPGLGRGSAQGDLRFLDVLAEMGAEVDVGPDGVEVRGTGELHGITADLADISDTAPTLAVAAACASTPTRVTGIGFIRRKETDRIAAVVAELRRCGVDAEEEADGFVVRPDRGALRGATVDTYDDHRMAMSFAVLGLRVPGIAVRDPDCVAKTFPTFFEVLDGLR
jgi:3-phosphoshikimate 1-carboxyvinyltransferase